jgi:DNA invertase Pin-like site-specific DNA recombinase
MPVEREPPIRCAIYTRKSSEEGLEQSFNSLDAQREACRAYIESQRHEGWRLVKTHYDDGGYSGGSMERPALKCLLKDIEAGKVDAVVVYKVDRLTRSLADFAKIIEIFDARGASFVSVTQQFNTTTSMGRLTLNVLLSFAQFEREVTGERIRDKIAASKRKGMWMGGNVPLGYDLKARKLLVNKREAALVRDIYRRYLALGCVRKLKLDLDRRGIRSKVRISPAKRRSGGSPYSRGALYKILQNRIYLGEIEHRGQTFAGEHEAIVPRHLWESVQARLRANNEARRNGTNCAAPSLLVGLLFDELGNRFTPSHAVKNGKRYRYYVSQAKIQHQTKSSEAPARIPAHEIEALVLSRIRGFLASTRELSEACGVRSAGVTLSKLAAAAESRFRGLSASSPAGVREFLQATIARIVVHEEEVEILVGRGRMRTFLLHERALAESGTRPKRNDLVSFRTKAGLKRCGLENRLVLQAPAEVAPRPASSLIKAVARAREWYERLTAGEATSLRALTKTSKFDESYVGRIIRCAFLAPDIVEAILDGTQPPALMLSSVQPAVPLDWAEQHRRFGYCRHIRVAEYSPERTPFPNLDFRLCTQRKTRRSWANEP